LLGDRARWPPSARRPRPRRSDLTLTAMIDKTGALYTSPLVGRLARRLRAPEALDRARVRNRPGAKLLH